MQSTKMQLLMTFLEYALIVAEFGAIDARFAALVEPILDLVVATRSNFSTFAPLYLTSLGLICSQIIINLGR